MTVGLSGGLATRGAAVVGLLALAPAARAADTWETWDRGIPAFEIYAGVDGLADDGSTSSLYLAPLLWVGLVERLSAFVALDFSATTELRDAGLGVAAFLLGTPLETDMVDLDLFLGVEWAGPSASTFSVRPALELNVDASPDMSTWGLYLRVDVPIAGPAAPDEDAAVNVEGLIGAYGIVAEGHELHLTLSAALGPVVEPVADPGGVGLGYNVLLSDSLELINEVTLDIPASGEPFSVGLMVGVIASLPTASGASNPAE